MSTVGTWLGEATKTLTQAKVGTARLDALVLLEDYLKVDRTKLLAEPERELSIEDVTKLTILLSRRAQHEPIAYIRGYTEFYGRNFVITPAVLEPRPESETMIELLLQLVKAPAFGSKVDQKLKIADIGTGSGALGITAQLELPNSQVELVEIDDSAIEVAKTNVDKFTLGINVIQSDLLADTKAEYDILLCNLPYVPDDHQINQAASNEPKLAIFGGPDGLDLYRKLFLQITNNKKGPLYILTESLPTQHTALQAIAEANGYKLEQTDDFIQVFALVQQHS